MHSSPEMCPEYFKICLGSNHVKCMKQNIFKCLILNNKDSIPAIQQKYWRAMVATDQYIAEVFPEPLLTAFRRWKSVGEYLKRKKLPPP